MFREAVWAVTQHYDLWPTPLIDVTPSLRVAASFALWNAAKEGHLYVVALPASTNSVTCDTDQHIVLARLQAVCPLTAKRPHYQDGFLAGRFPFAHPTPNQIDNNPAEASSLSRRLLARIILRDDPTADGARGKGFWCNDFPRMSKASLMPGPEKDEMLSKFDEYKDEIDAKMEQICS